MEKEKGWQDPLKTMEKLRQSTTKDGTLTNASDWGVPVQPTGGAATEGAASDTQTKPVTKGVEEPWLQ